jgi:hypothetical protein
MHFDTKSYLKSNYNNTDKYSFNLESWWDNFTSCLLIENRY